MLTEINMVNSRYMTCIIKDKENSFIIQDLRAYVILGAYILFRKSYDICLCMPKVNINTILLY